LRAVPTRLIDAILLDIGGVPVTVFRLPLRGAIIAP